MRAARSCPEAGQSREMPAYARMPTPDETRRLNLGPGTPVAYHICTGFTEADQPVRVVLNVLPGDRHIIAYERAAFPATTTSNTEDED